MRDAGRVRVLGPGDEAAARAFFERHPDTTLFFQNNVAAAGLADRGVPYSGTYAAAFEGDEIAAMAAHYWQGNLILEAPRALDEVARTAIAASGRPVSGLLGPWAQVQAARAALGLATAATTMDSPDALFAMSLAALRAPALLSRADVRCRHPRASELERVIAWREDYAAALLGQARGPELAERSRGEILRNQEEGRNFVLEVAGELVAYSGYNAQTPRCVQIGGVWTPVALRRRGYARAAVAGSLLAARTRGVERSILFTGEENRAAQAAYRALGYERVGDYGLVLFAEPCAPR
jgi:RimJ/RimL family protein N-acetyltransferase